MSRKTATRSPYTKRVGVPELFKDKEGNAILLCPFCNPSHPLKPGVVSACGTILILTAEQTVIRAKYEKNMICVKCGKGGGEMVMRQNTFVHLEDCTPGVAFLTEPPNFSSYASLVNSLKPRVLKDWVERRTGHAMPVDEVLQDGTRTGKVLGYFFLKENKNGKHPQTTT